MAARAWEFVPPPLTSPAQPLKSAAEEVRITTATAHTHPLKLASTFVTFLELGQLVKLGRGWGPRKWLLSSARILCEGYEYRTIITTDTENSFGLRPKVLGHCPAY
jgi:hypothetical protein